jgi:hypothetical protein
MSFDFRRPRLFSTQTGISLALISALVLGCDRPDPTEPPLSGPSPSLVTSLSIAAVAASAHDGNVPQNTLDNNLETWWAAQGDGQWIRYDLGATTGVSRVDIAWYLGDTRISFFDIQVSADAVSWTTVFTGQSSGQTRNHERYNLPISSARYVRIVGHGSSSGTGWNSITEVDIYQTPVVTVTASAHDGNVPQNTLDNNLETWWAAQGDGQWIRYDLGAMTEVGRVDIAWYVGDTRTSFFDIEVSADAVSWSNVFSGQSSGQTRQLERYDVPTSSARYVRIVGHGSSSGTGWNSITEVDIYHGGGGSPPPPPPPPPVGFFVTTSGGTGDGSEAQPWSLSYAFSGAGGKLHPGDTVWIHGGDYTGNFSITASGTAENSRVVFRSYPNERPILKTTLFNEQLVVRGNWVLLWGLELMNTNTTRNTAASRGNNLVNNGNCNRYLNMIVHDGGVAFYNWTHRYGVEVIGSIFYNNGYQDFDDPTDRGHGHGMYIKGDPGNTGCVAGKAAVVIRDNIAFNQFGWGVHAYTDDGDGNLSNILIEGNVSFNNGSISRSDQSNRSGNILLGGYAFASDDTVRANMSYYSPLAQLANPGSGISIGWDVNSDDVVVTDNYTSGGAYALRFRNWNSVVVSNNVTHGEAQVVRIEDPTLTGYTWTSNTHHRDENATAWYYGGSRTFSSWRGATGLGGTDQIAASTPTTNKVVVRKIPGVKRGNIIIYNWTNAGSVPVDLSSVLSNNDHYEIRNVQNYFATNPVVSGTYTGGTVNIPMGGVTPPVPVGSTPRTAPQTGPKFDVFIVEKR